MYTSLTLKAQRLEASLRKRGLSVLIFDANGEEQGRSSAGFKWALNIEGAIDMIKGELRLR
jgi:cysteine desulfurase